VKLEVQLESLLVGLNTGVEALSQGEERLGVVGVEFHGPKEMAKKTKG